MVTDRIFRKTIKPFIKIVNSRTPGLSCTQYINYIRIWSLSHTLTFFLSHIVILIRIVNVYYIYTFFSLFLLTLNRNRLHKKIFIFWKTIKISTCKAENRLTNRYINHLILLWPVAHLKHRHLTLYISLVIKIYNLPNLI